MLGCTFVPPAIAVATLKSAWWVSQAWIEARKYIFFPLLKSGVILSSNSVGLEKRFCSEYVTLTPCFDHRAVLILLAWHDPLRIKVLLL